MYPYSSVQWVLFFYIYCFLGWVWETSYVSVRKRKFVNRGFMHGPFLTIYGFGAIMILVITIPVQEKLMYVFITGMLGATILEYFTGTLMESLFHVRYWDYSQKLLNLKGQICLESSIAWGVMAIIITDYLHRVVETIVFGIPKNLVEIIVVVMTLGIGIDFTQSFNEAMDLKEILMNLTESHEEIRRIVDKIETISKTIGDDRKELKEKAAQSKQMLEDRIREVKEKYELSERASSYMAEIKKKIAKDEKTDHRDLESILTELESCKENIYRQLKKFSSNPSKSYFRSMKMLRRNPDAKSDHYSDALDLVKKLDSENSNHH